MWPSSLLKESPVYRRTKTALSSIYEQTSSSAKLKSSWKVFVLHVKRQHAVRIILFGAVACCFAHLSWTSSSVIPESNTLRIEQDDVIKNTNWKNVQFNSGVLGKGLSKLSGVSEGQIVGQCMKLSGWTFHNYPSRVEVDCMGPLATDTSCCYCYFSRDDEQVNFSAHFKYWSCAVARNHSLLSLNATPLNTLGKRVALITGRFGHGDYFKPEVYEYCGKLQNMSILDPNDMHCFWDSPDYVLQNPKFRRHLRYRDEKDDLSKKGGGFWFHKSVLLRHHLDVYIDGDYLVYTDIDRYDYFRSGTFHAMVETVAKRGDDLSIEIVGNAAEVQFCKEDMLVAFNATQSMRESPQVLANAVVVRNSPKMKRFVEAWVECASDWHMISDEPSVIPNGEKYVDHRHDQSILSLLIKKYMSKQSVVGPPARPYLHISEILTYRFQEGAEPTCPFSYFNATSFVALLNKTA